MHRDRTPGAQPTRQERILRGITALRDATRALRGDGAARRSGGDDADRGALFDLAALADRLSGWADDQTEDDWADFWLTAREVESLQVHTASLAATARGLSPGTLPALRALADALRSIARTMH